MEETTISMEELNKLKNCFTELGKIKAIWAANSKKGAIKRTELANKNYAVYKEIALSIINACPVMSNAGLARLVIEELAEKEVFRLLSVNRLRVLFKDDKEIQDIRGKLNVLPSSP